MNIKKNHIKTLSTLFILLTSFLSCSRQTTIAAVSESDLFTLNYGNFEDELNLFDLAAPGNINTFMTMRDGFFYIANGASKKIIELNSYGDLLSLYYNKEAMRNLYFVDQNSENSTKKAVSYPFISLGALAVDSQKCLYAVDTLPQERQERDEEKRLLLNNVVLRFDENGNFTDYIGQQGPGGTPFSVIKNIYTTKDNELVVVCSVNNGFDVYWFGSNGFLLYQIPINENTVPKIRKDEDELQSHFSIGNVVPDYNTKKLYVKVDYYDVYIDPDLKMQSGIDYTKTMLYPFDITTEKYEDGFDIPAYECATAEGMGQDVYEIPFDFFGVTENGWLFFIVPTDDGYIVQMVQPDGQSIVKRQLSVDHSKILYHSLSLSNEGIISGLFVRKENAEVAWWRTDSLIASFMSN